MWDLIELHSDRHMRKTARKNPSKGIYYTIQHYNNLY